MIKHFKDLTTWQKAHQLVLVTYNETQQLPSEERYGLTSQMRRAAVSITSNIAEGFGRQSDKDRERFYVMAYGSLTELENQFIIAHDLEFIDTKKFLLVNQRIQEVGQLLNGLLRAHKLRQSSDL